MKNSGIFLGKVKFILFFLISSLSCARGNLPDESDCGKLYGNLQIQAVFTMYPVEIDGVQKNVVLIEAYLKNVGNQAIDVPLGTSLAIETKRVGPILYHFDATRNIFGKLIRYPKSYYNFVTLNKDELTMLPPKKFIIEESSEFKAESIQTLYIVESDFAKMMNCWSGMICVNLESSVDLVKRQQKQKGSESSN